MAPRRSRANTPEFPMLEANALYAGEIKGDGNCLFNALSDQLYGTQEYHEVLRIETIEHMKQRSDHYRQYMTVNTVRRNPKRKSKAALSRLDTTACTEDELQKQFEQHVEKMGQPGEWADNMEVSAFASAYQVHVRLWQAEYTLLISPSFDNEIYQVPGVVDERETLHIAYHTWEHYSSVRNIDGPHTGKPEVSVIPPRTSMRKRPSPSISGDDDEEMPRARKRRSPLPLFDSDSTPEYTESSSDESNGFTTSQPRLELPEPEPEPEPNAKPQKLTIKLRCLRTTDSAEPAEPVTAIPPPTVTPPSPMPPSHSPAPASPVSASQVVASVDPAPSQLPPSPVLTPSELAASPKPMLHSSLPPSPAPSASATTALPASDVTASSGLAARSPLPTPLSPSPVPLPSAAAASSHLPSSISSTPTKTTVTAI